MAGVGKITSVALRVASPRCKRPWVTDSYGKEEVLDQGAPSGARHVCREFLQKMVVVIRPCAFRLRRLAQSPLRDLGPGHFGCEFSHKMALRRCPKSSC